MTNLISKALDRLAITAEKMRGLDVREPMSAVDAGLDATQSHYYSPSGDKYLAHVLKELHITERDSIIDVGCGKGSAMLVMLRFPFAQVDGVELSAPLVSIASHNLLRYGYRQAHLFRGDARYFGLYPYYNMVYFYNPFPKGVMAQVIGRVEESIRYHPRVVRVIYNNPTCHEVVVAGGVFEQSAEFPNRWGTGIRVYANRQDAGR